MRTSARVGCQRSEESGWASVGPMNSRMASGPVTGGSLPGSIEPFGAKNATQPSIPFSAVAWSNARSAAGSASRSSAGAGAPSAASASAPTASGNSIQRFPFISYPPQVLRDSHPLQFKGWATRTENALEQHLAAFEAQSQREMDAGAGGALLGLNLEGDAQQAVGLDLKGALEALPLGARAAEVDGADGRDEGADLQALRRGRAHADEELALGLVAA